jgi:hypothetical protein
MRFLSTCIALCLLTGCTLFPQQTQSNASLLAASGVDPTSLPLGQWCRVTLREEKRGSYEARAEHIGQLQQADDGSITLTEVTTHRRFIPTSRLHKIPYVSRLYKKSGIDTLHEPAPITVARDRIARIEVISPEAAEQLKQPIERIGIDFDFSLVNE